MSADQRLLEARVSTRSARASRVCGYLDDDGIDYCGREPGHAGGHYCMDPAGRIRTRRPCLVCREATTAHLCVCPACGGPARLGSSLDPLTPPSARLTEQALARMEDQTAPKRMP